MICVPELLYGCGEAWSSNAKSLPFWLPSMGYVGATGTVTLPSRDPVSNSCSLPAYQAAPGGRTGAPGSQSLRRGIKTSAATLMSPRTTVRGKPGRGFWIDNVVAKDLVVTKEGTGRNIQLLMNAAPWLRVVWRLLACAILGCYERRPFHENGISDGRV